MASDHRPSIRDEEHPGSDGNHAQKVDAGRRGGKRS